MASARLLNIILLFSGTLLRYLHEGRWRLYVLFFVSNIGFFRFFLSFLPQTLLLFHSLLLIAKKEDSVFRIRGLHVSFGITLFHQFAIDKLVLDENIRQAAGHSDLFTPRQIQTDFFHENEAPVSFLARPSLEKNLNRLLSRTSQGHQSPRYRTVSPLSSSIGIPVDNLSHNILVFLGLRQPGREKRKDCYKNKSVLLIMIDFTSFSDCAKQVSQQLRNRSKEKV